MPNGNEDVTQKKQIDASNGMSRHPEDLLSQTGQKISLLIGAVTISFSPILVKIASLGYENPTAVAFYRTAIGGGFLLLIVVTTGRSLRMPPGAMIWALLAGIFFFLDLSCWHRSILYVGAGMATILGNTQVFSTALASRFLFNEKLTFSTMLGAVATFVGIGLLVGIGNRDLAVGENYPLGVMLGLLTGLLYSGFLICLKKGNSRAERPDLVVFMTWTSLFSAVFLGLEAWLVGEDLVPTQLETILALLGLGVVIQALAWLVITHALPAVSIVQAGLILLLQPALATAWGGLFFSESLQPVQMFGALVALVGMYFGGLRRSG